MPKKREMPPKVKTKKADRADMSVGVYSLRHGQHFASNEALAEYNEKINADKAKKKKSVAVEVTDKVDDEKQTSKPATSSTTSITTPAKSDGAEVEDNGNNR